MEKDRQRFRVSIPKAVVHDKGWEDVRYVRIEGQWGDRIMITRVSDEEGSEKEDKPRSLGRD